MIITSDLHLRTIPARCRQKQWTETQKCFLQQLASEQDDICIIGDIFNSANEVNPELLGYIQKLALSILPHKLYILAGNHDLSFHSISNLEKSPISLLLRSRNIFHISKLNIGMSISACNFGVTPEPADIIFLHQLVSDVEFPGATLAQDIIKQYPNAKYIFTGDNHHAFKYKNLYNCGTPIRQTLDLKNYIPKIIKWDLINEPQLVNYPHDNGQFLEEPLQVCSILNEIETTTTCLDFETLLYDNIALLDDNKKTLILGILNEIK